jgi:hypothetical protein
MLSQLDVDLRTRLLPEDCAGICTSLLAGSIGHCNTISYMTMSKDGGYVQERTTWPDGRTGWVDVEDVEVRVLRT